MRPAPAPDLSHRWVDGGTFIFDTPDSTPIIWGHDDHIYWAQGESLILVGPPGVGKTTLMIQIVLARLGLLANVLGEPVTQTSERVLYLACDRPRQITRAFRRVTNPDQRAILTDRLEFWKGPPPTSFAKDPYLLTAMAFEAKADTVILDSLKDVAPKLSDDETGSAVNTAIQNALAEGIDVGALHHQRKGQAGNKPNSLEDVYGSIWITAGAGSVVLLWGAAGDAIVELSHLKQPADTIGPLQIAHDHDTGLSSIHRGMADPLIVLRSRPAGMTTIDLAALMFESKNPNDNQRKKAQRQLDRLVHNGLAHKREHERKGTRADGTKGVTPARYYATTREGQIGTETTDNLYGQTPSTDASTDATDIF